MLWEKEEIKGEIVYAKLMDKNEQKIFLKECSAKLNLFGLSKAFLRKRDFVAQESRLTAINYSRAVNLKKRLLFTTRLWILRKITLPTWDFAMRIVQLCFLRLKQYALCLADIERAKRNNYPARLISKLETRRIECEELLTANGDAGLQREEPKLSFEADQKIPCFAEGLEMKFSEDHRNHITTNRDFDIGQTVIVERALFFGSLSVCECCENCLKRNVNLIPCENCNIAMFCSEECRDAANERFHDALCNTENSCGKPMQQLLLQSLIIAIKTFSTAAALMNAVEKFRTLNSNEISFDDQEKRDYFQFFKIRTNVHKFTAERKNELMRNAMEVVEIIKSVSSVQSMFRSTKMAQFLSHLAVHHMHILSSTAYTAKHAVYSAYESALGLGSTSETTFGFGLVPYSSQLNRVHWIFAASS